MNVKEPLDNNLVFSKGDNGYHFKLEEISFL